MKPTIEKTKEVCEEVFGKTFSYKEAGKVLGGFLDYRGFADKMDISKFQCKVIDPKTIEEYVQLKKYDENRKNMEEEAREKRSKTFQNVSFR